MSKSTITPGRYPDAERECVLLPKIKRGQFVAGEWACDNSRHMYTLRGDEVVGFLWEAVDKRGQHHFGVNYHKEDAETKAKTLAGEFGEQGSISI